jgi:hypothetical protein
MHQLELFVQNTHELELVTNISRIKYEASKYGYLSLDNRILMLQHLPDQFNEKTVEALSIAKKNI